MYNISEDYVIYIYKFSTLFKEAVTLLKMS